MEVAIYSLDSPDDPTGSIYIGATAHPEARRLAHSNGKTTTSVREWVATLPSAPRFTILRRVPEEEAREAEQAAVADALRAGKRILNGLTNPYRPRKPHADPEHQRRDDEPVEASGGEEARQAPRSPPGGSGDGLALAHRETRTLTLDIYAFETTTLDAQRSVRAPSHWPPGATVVLALVPNNP